MKITKLRYLRGANLYAAHPCLLATIDLQQLKNASTADLPDFGGGLLALMPSLRKRERAGGRPGGFVERLEQGAHFADVVKHVTMELQQLAGHQVVFSHVGEVRGQDSCYNVVCAYVSERTVTAALEMALELVPALASRQPYAYADKLAQLRRLAQRSAVGTSTGAVVGAAQRRGIPAHRITESANLFQLGWGSKQKRLQATMTGATSHIAVGLASDKHLTKALLEEAGLPVPQGETVTDIEEARQVARRLHCAVTIKPLDANQGKGVTTICNSDEEIAAAFEHARQYSRHVIVERHLKGRDYRVLVAGGAIAAASYRRPPLVTGDGASTIRELVEVENRNPARGEGHSNILTRITLDDHALAAASKQGFDFDSVPPAGVEVELRGNANLSTGGTAEDVTDLLPASTARICIRAASSIGLDVAGIDIICEDISQPLAEQGGGIIEVNAAPGIRMHQYPSRGTPRDAGDAIVEAMFGDSDGRIPVVAITGTNGKTTTTRLIAHAAGLTGLHTGMSTTEGVYIDGVLLEQGDCTGYHSARMVLSAPEVEFAVLETARGGILKRGLAFDRCDVGVVLNVTEDHLGMDGVDTLQDLARVKQVVANAAAGAVVLNAEDPLCVAMAAQLRSGVELLYFSLDAENPELLRHLEQGGRAVYLQDSMAILADGERHQMLLDVRRMPVTLSGAARYNVANALAAAAALTAAGFTPEQVVQGLASFVSDGRSNPLRSNIFDVNGIKVVVDFAHNGAAYMALSEMARGMTAGKVVGVVSVPGDRRDEDLVQIGKVCAAGFDDLVIYESENRGRAQGETARLLTNGARSADVDTGRLHCKLDVHRAIRFGLGMCKPGDVLVFGCGSSMSELIEALRPEMPAIAERIASETETPA
ncbi:cyanophycin synthetase [Duganella aceris]|uniref:Cyanophycin synthetase n=1 Tax=Duganella aceris TaxID=2703883 RepID=A0ABX0FP25_9BURK|nr:cyanophycin synthetase [Duganella aceris]NGZ86243.1 cyanophycin synthetase [Duganella aceris]